MEFGELLEGSILNDGNGDNRRNNGNVTFTPPPLMNLMGVVDAEMDMSNYYKSANWNNLSNVLWRDNEIANDNLNEFLSPKTVGVVSRKITELTMGLNSEGRPIVVPNKNILSVMNEVYRYQRPRVGCIYSRYIVPDSAPRNDVQEMIDKTIQIICSDIKANLGMDRNNSKLSIWATKYGEGNPWGLQQVSRGFAKINNRRPTIPLYNMNY